MKKSFVHMISRAHTQLSNAANHPEILPALEEIGYPLSRIQEGLGLLNTVQITQDDRLLRQAEQNSISKSIQEDTKDLWKAHMPHRKLAQVAFRNDVFMYEQLGLKSVSTSIEHRLAYLEKFYQLLLSEPAGIVPFGLSEAELAQMHASVQALLQARLKRTSCKGETQNATQKRNQAIKNLDLWMSDFRKAARFALRNEPQLLETLGILVRSPA